MASVRAARAAAGALMRSAPAGQPIPALHRMAMLGCRRVLPLSPQQRRCASTVVVPTLTEEGGAIPRAFACRAPAPSPVAGPARRADKAQSKLPALLASHQPADREQLVSVTLGVLRGLATTPVVARALEAAVALRRAPSARALVDLAVQKGMLNNVLTVPGMVLVSGAAAAAVAGSSELAPTLPGSSRYLTSPRWTARPFASWSSSPPRAARPRGCAPH
jgi:hypothetical protein